MNYLFYLIFAVIFVSAEPAQTQVSAKKLITNENKAFVSPISSLSGNWEGSYFCGQGTTGINLAIKPLKNNQVQVVANFYALPSNPTVPSGSFKMVGTYTKGINDDAPGILDLKATQWIKQPPGYVMASFQGNVFLKQNKIVGRILSPGCTTIEVYKKNN